MTSVSHAAKYDEWKGVYNWETCITNREQYGNFLISILTSEKNGHVLNLNGAWGTGKTEFLKRLYVTLARKKHPVIYIDAWESDFIQDPLTVVCSEFLNQLGFIFSNCDNKTKLEEVKGKINSLMGSIASVSNIVSKPIIAGFKVVNNDATYTDQLDLMQTLLEINTKGLLPNRSVEENNYDLLKQMLGTQAELVEGMKNIRKQISAISEILEHVYDLECPIVVLIDELDRCRPDYAIKMLEVVKHFFDVDGCNFLIATDTESLQESIKSVYGSGFDSKRYLNRFFNQRIALKRPSINEYIANKNIDFDELAGDIRVLPFEQDKDQKITFLSNLLDDTHFELRDIDRFLQKLTASINYIKNNRAKNLNFINFVVLSYAIFEHEKNSVSFHRRENSHPQEVSGMHGTLDGRLSLNAFVSVYIKMVTVLKSNQRVSLDGGKSVLKSQTEVLAIESGDHRLRNNDAWRSNYLSDAQGIINEFHKSQATYWLWEDYQKLVGLTDAIE